MTDWRTGGAFVAGERPKTKKALREAFANAPESVRFQTFSPWGVSYFQGAAHPLSADITDVTTDTVVHVHGPDPERDRRWIATLEFVRGAWKLS